MLRVQLTGIRVDGAQRDALLSEVESEYYDAHHSLTMIHDIQVERALRDGDYLATCLSHRCDSGLGAEKVIADLRESEPVCALLHAIKSGKRSKRILLRTFSFDDELCYPVFDTLGTVTGRILAVDPHLQYLRKAYRSILVPRLGRRLVYLDYSQFEPNIMASLSHDPQLLQICREGHLYSELATRLFRDREARGQAKTLFLAYSYGMGKEGLADLASKTTGDRSGSPRLLDEHFHPLVRGLQRWRESLHEKLIAAGRIGTAFGNYRNRSREGPLDSSEERWAISQVVQGTGALILKRVVAAISSRMPEAQILLPMHDALLLEIPTAGALEATEQLVAVFIAEFGETCPGLEPRVSVKQFAVSKEASKTFIE